MPFSFKIKKRLTGKGNKKYECYEMWDLEERANAFKI